MWGEFLIRLRLVRIKNSPHSPLPLPQKSLSMKTACPALFLFLFFTNILSAQLQYFPEELIVNASSLNLRDKPDKSGKVVEKMPRGSALSLVELVNGGEYVEVDSINGYWVKVQYKNKTGYVFSPYVVGTYNLYQDNDVFDTALPQLNWYGVYMRDSFADELRKIEVRLEEEYSDFYGGRVKFLKTNQTANSKFLIATANPLQTGLVSNLGAFDPGTLYMSSELSPGAMMPIQPGQEMSDTNSVGTYYLAATGCAQFEETDFVQIRDYRLYAMEFQPNGPSPRQDITGWVQPEPGLNPSVSLVWFGDLDHDRKPDAIIQDAPFESGARISLFLSSKAKPGAFLHKVCEYFFPID